MIISARSPQDDLLSSSSCPSSDDHVRQACYGCDPRRRGCSRRAGGRRAPRGRVRRGGAGAGAQAAQRLRHVHPGAELAAGLLLRQGAAVPGCRAPQSFWRSHLTLHGLWPELSGSAPPSFCSGEAFDADKIERELGIDTLHQYWPDVKFSEASPQYADFWKHEWTRHGTCSGLKQIDYFTHAINLERNETLAPTPQLVQDNVGGQVDVEKLRAAFGDAALKCQCSHAGGGDDSDAKHATLFSQVFTCWEKDEHNVPTQRRACPPHIHSEDSCGKAGSVTIPAFPTGD